MLGKFMIFLIGTYSGKISIGRPECGLLWVTILKVGRKEEEKGQTRKYLSIFPGSLITFVTLSLLLGVRGLRETRN